MTVIEHDPKHVEAVLVAADRLREAYEAMIEGRDVGWLPDWQPSADHWRGAVALLADVAQSGVAFEDPRISYVEVQIDRGTWEALTAYSGDAGSEGSIPVPEQ